MGVLFPAAAAPRCRYIQELRGSLSYCLHGWQRCGDAWKGRDLRAQGRERWWWQEEVSAKTPHLFSFSTKSSCHVQDVWHPACMYDLTFCCTLLNVHSLFIR